MTEEFVQLLDGNNETIGVMEKMQAHREGALHRAVSVFVFNSKGEMLLQQRAAGKYHSPGLWSNACCTHPRPGEEPLKAAERRLQEEMGIECSLEYKFDFLYKAELGNGLTEHEYDHVYYGYTNEKPVPDNNEVAAWSYLSMDELDNRLREQPAKFTVWFHLLFGQLKHR